MLIKNQQPLLPTEVQSAREGNTTTPATGGFASLLQSEQDSLSGSPSAASSATPMAPAAGNAETEPESSARSRASAEFHAYMEKSDAEKIRESILNEMGLTEEEFRELPAEEQLAIERKVAERLKEQSGVSSAGFKTSALDQLL